MTYTPRTSIDPTATSGPELADIVEDVGHLTQLTVISRTTDQPASPTEGDAYIANANWTDATTDDVAVFIDSAWRAFTPEEGWSTWVQDEDLGVTYNGAWLSSQAGAADPENATDSGTDAYVSETTTSTPGTGNVILRDFQSANTTTTPTLDGVTIKTRDGSALWAGALDGVHSLQYDGTDYLLIDPVYVTAQKEAYAKSETYSQAEVDARDPTLGTEVDMTNGGSNDQSAIEFTGLNSPKRITILIHEMSADANVDFVIQIGDSGGYETSGYSASSARIANASSVDTTVVSSGFVIKVNNSSDILSGIIQLVLENDSDNRWVGSHMLGRTDASVVYTGGGHKALSANLDRLRIKAGIGTDNFDSGNINIMVEE